MDALPDKIRRVKHKYFQNFFDEFKKRPHRVCTVALEYAQVTRRVFKVRVMVLEYAPRKSGTRQGFRVRYGTRRSFRVRVIVLGCVPGF